MYLSTQLILKSIGELKRIHPFHGITFLVCKRKKLPIDGSIHFPMNTFTRKHMDIHHKLASDSKFYFQPFHSTQSTKYWLKHDYPSSGLQAINTQTFGDAFLHDRGSTTWGWRTYYLDVVSEILERRVRGQRIPAWALAVWLYRSEEWIPSDDLNTITSRFIEEYHITSEERERLFSVELPDHQNEMLFHDAVSDWNALKQEIQPPPDANPERGGALVFLHVHGTGPTSDMLFRPAGRMTIITGDNGLGKSFLMECAWWALTGNWADRPAFPNLDSDQVYIEFDIQGSYQSRRTHPKIYYDRKQFRWPHSDGNRHTIPGLVIYARVDGSFAVWDPIKSASDRAPEDGLYTLSSDNIWNGQKDRNEGLVRDWIKWQNAPDKYPFEMLSKVLARLSPPDLGELRTGDSVRIPGDPREIPTVIHRCGTTPVLYASAGIKRILALSYLMVWAWNEHLIAAKLARRRRENRMVVLVDEMEAHLHPKWQREVLPALSSVSTYLEKDLNLQLIISTHSPLVVASAESIFESEKDAFIHLDILESGEITMEELPFVKYGDVSSWLTSPVFQLGQARSRDAEKAIQKAKDLQAHKEKATKEKVVQTSNMLAKCLPSHDKFWPRWIAFAEEYGVEL